MLEVITHGLFQSTLTNALFNIHEERCDLNGFGVCTLLASIQRKTTDKKNIQAVFISVFFVAECLFSTCFVYLSHFDQFQEEPVMEVTMVILVMRVLTAPPPTQ